jgi:hypothetical protein
MTKVLDLPEEYFWSDVAEAYEHLAQGGMLGSGCINGPLELYTAYEFDMRDVVTLLMAGESIEEPIVMGTVRAWAQRFAVAHPNRRRRSMWRWLATLPGDELLRILEQAAYVEHDGAP